MLKTLPWTTHKGPLWVESARCLGHYSERKEIQNRLYSLCSMLKNVYTLFIYFLKLCLAFAFSVCKRMVVNDIFIHLVFIKHFTNQTECAISY